MKILTTNFLTCAVKSCRSSPLSFPLHFHDAVLSRTELPYQELFIQNILPRVQYDALITTAKELSLQALVPEREVFEGLQEAKATGQEAGAEGMEQSIGNAASQDGADELLKKLHTLLMETEVREGKLVCGNCGFEYPIKEGVGNFLLPSHLV